MIIKTDGRESFKELNARINSAKDKEIILEGCMGQRYIGCGLSDKKIVIRGVAGNALGAYLSGGEIFVCGNAQDAVGDTMNDGLIVVHGNAGDATGYSMRGGRIFVKGNIGYRAGIHMKEYGEQIPALVAGGRAGSFLGEYQAGGVIVILGMNDDGLPIINNFCGTGMHGGAIYLRCGKIPKKLPEQVQAKKIKGGDDELLKSVVADFCKYFNEFDEEEILNSDFFVLTPNTSNPYKQMYTDN